MNQTATRKSVAAMAELFSDLETNDGVEGVVDTLEELRSIRIPLPDWANEGWIQEAMDLSNRDVRLFHEAYGSAIEVVTGFPWPRNKPKIDDIGSIVARAAVYPLFMPMFVRGVAAVGRSPIGARFKDNFRKLYEAVGVDSTPSETILESARLMAFFQIPAVVMEGILDKAGDIMDYAEVPDVWRHAFDEGMPTLMLTKAARNGLLMPSDDPIHVLRRDWLRHRSAMREVLSDVRSPSLEVVATVEAIVADLRSTAEAMENLAPRLVPTDEVVQQLLTAASALEDVAGDYFEEADDARSRLTKAVVSLSTAPAEVEAPVIEVVRAEAVRAELCLDASRDAVDRFKEIDSDSALAPRARRKATDPILEEIEARASEGIAHVQEAVRTLGSSSSGLVVEATTNTTVLQDDEPKVDEGIRDSSVGGTAADDGVEDLEVDPVESEQTMSAIVEDDIDLPVVVETAPLSLPQVTATVDAGTLAPRDRDGEAAGIIDLVSAENEELRCTDPTDESSVEVVQRMDAGVDRMVGELFAERDFGLLHHLARTIPAVANDVVMRVSADEMRIVAVGRRAKGMQDQQIASFREALEACIDVANDLSRSSGPWTDARRVALLASTICVAAFDGNDAQTAAQIVDRIGTDGVCTPFFGLVKAVEESRRRGFPLDSTMVRMVGLASKGDAYVVEAEQAFDKAISSLSNAKFRFVLGQRVKGWLVTDGPIGRLRSALSTGDRGTVLSRFATEYGSREAVIETLRRGCMETERGGEVDGPARDRMVYLMNAVTTAAGDLAGALDGVSTVNSGRSAQMKDLAEAFVKGYERFLREAPQETGDRLVDAAFAHAREVLSFLVQTLGGPVSGYRRRRAVDDLHAPLLWLPGLSWAGAWTPSPYDDAAIAGAILAMGPRNVQADPAGSLTAAFQDRIAEGSHVAARMLLAISDRFGVDPSTQAEASTSLDEDEIVRREEVATRHAHVARMIDKIRRMAIGGIDAAVRLSTGIDAIVPSELPADVSVEIMPESLPEDRIRDFSAALRRLDAIELSARSLLDGAKVEFEERISDLATRGVVDARERGELEALLAMDDLATVSDWIAMFDVTGEPRPVLMGSIVNVDLHRFEERLEDGVLLDTDRVVEAIATKRRFGPYDLTIQDPGTIDTILDRVRDWKAMRRIVSGGKASLDTVVGQSLSIVAALTGETPILIGTERDAHASRGMFSFDVRIPYAADPGSLVLPEFGSGTNGVWRLFVAPPSATPAEIAAATQGLEPRGALVLFMGTLSIEKRRRLKQECVAKGRRVLVVDEALVIDSLLSGSGTSTSALVVAQAYSSASPYRDYVSSPVPPEMFKGRVTERARIVDPYGSYIVYGGRRLGKTALLRHIEATSGEHSTFCFVDLRETGSAQFWSYVSSRLPKVFRHGMVETAGAFVDRVQEWLADDDRRRLVLMLDEADNFVVEQATGGYRHVVALLNLMASSRHRFKFVLAGLHNVTRIVRTDNSPLAQMSNDPVRIGPLGGGDVGDAELLVRGPLAALGYEFERREDVWRILSIANYYPVLIQVFCQGLLRLLEEETQRLGTDRIRIDGAMVDAALGNERIRKGLYESFDKTISGIEQRYALLTYVLAERALEDVGIGADSEGLEASDVASRAAAYWPEAFPPGSDPSQVDDLLDEMEGFGILRWNPAGRWALRSRTLLDLMVTSDVQILEKLANFAGRPVEPPFDPRSIRRVLGRGNRARNREEGLTSPMTDGQEAEILGRAGGHGDPGVTALFGTRAAGIDFVSTAVETFHSDVGKGHGELELRQWRHRDELVSFVRALRRDATVVVSEKSNWTADWINEVLGLPTVSSGRARVLFVGDASHARAWASAESRRPETVRIDGLRPWTRSFIASRLDAMNEMSSERIDMIVSATGGWNVPTHRLFAKAQAGVGLRAAMVDALADRDRSGLEAVGILPADVDLYRELASWAEEGALDRSTMDELVSAAGHDPDEFLTYSTVVGLITMGPISGSGTSTIYVNALARRLLLHVGRSVAA